MKICQIYNSKADVYGNRYWAFEFMDQKKNLVCNHISVCASIQGGGSESNIVYAVRGLADHWQTHELPIWAFNKMTKSWPCISCGSEEIAAWIKKALRAERKKLKES